jgi:signal transduction histidine kinase
MNALFGQLGSLLTSAPGGLTYQLVLAFSIAATLQFAFTDWRAGGAIQDRRALMGLGAMLVVLALQFVLGMIAVAGGGLQAALPPLDRAVTVVLLALAMWLWSFPAPSRQADISAIVIAVVAAIAGGLTALLSGPGVQSGGFNRTFLDTVWQVGTIALLALGATVLYIRRVNGFAFGLAFAGLALLGHLIHLVWRGPGDYSGAIRLAHMAAFPLLLTLPQRVRGAVATTVPPSEEAPLQRPEAKRYGADPRTVHALLGLAAEADGSHALRSVARAVARTMLADLCLLMNSSEDGGHLSIVAGYDLIREDYIEGSVIESTSVPRLASAIQRNRPLRVAADGTAEDARALAGLLGLREHGDLLEAPILTPENDSLGALVLLAPFSHREWDNEDQNLLVSVASALVPVMQRGQGITVATAGSGSASQREMAAAEDVLELRRRNNDLAQQLETLALETEGAAAELSELENLRTANEQAHRTIAELESARSKAGEPGGPVQKELEAQLKASLQDMARLQNQLGDSQQRILELEGQAGGDRRRKEQAEVIASISQELRQPMSSIIGYTDLLLGESVGILGALQRKFIERIKASTERIGGLIDDLIQLSTLEVGLSELKPEAMDLNLIIDNALAYTSSQVREKKIAIHLDLPRNLAAVSADREALQQILIHLLQNAGTASPMEGSIGLKVLTSMDDGRPYVMIQVTDSGGGIPEEDLPRVFTRLFRADNVLIQGVGDTGVGLSIAKTLTEAQSGRIWVETQPGVGTTFSVLLPAVPEAIGRAPGKETR